MKLPFFIFSDRSNAKWENTSNNWHFLLHYTVIYQNYKYRLLPLFRTHPLTPVSSVSAAKITFYNAYQVHCFASFNFKFKSKDEHNPLPFYQSLSPLHQVHCFASFNFKYKSTVKITGNGSIQVGQYQSSPTRLNSTTQRLDDLT